MRHQQPVRIEEPCAHVDQVTIKEVKRPGDACEECVQIGGEWVHLRVCLTCGHVSCCDSSPNRHASQHAHSTHHPIVTSAEAGETWVWCFADDMAISP